jgi:hypothetical protein
MAEVAPARVYLHWFAVSGRGPLPWRMARLDRCWPRRQVDADSAHDDQEREIQLEAEQPGNWAPTTRWWTEHGWDVMWHEIRWQSGYRGEYEAAHKEPPAVPKGKRRPKRAKGG